VVLGVLVFTKNAYTSSLSSFYTFYVIERFGLTAQQSQLMLFVFLGAMAAGVMLGGPIGDRIGPLAVIWVSILGVLPFTLALPYVGALGLGGADRRSSGWSSPRPSRRSWSLRRS
jgi:FSR family fosmidomycin resistance protein-like MFS transporter